MKKVVYAVCGLVALSCVVGCAERQYSAKECNAAWKEYLEWEFEGKGRDLTLEILAAVITDKMTEDEGEKKYEKSKQKQYFSKVLASCDKSVKSGLLTVKSDKWELKKTYADVKPQGK